MRLCKLSVAAVAAAAGLALSVSTTVAQPIEWASAVDSAWNVPSNWNPANVPNDIGEQASLGFNTAYTVTFNLTAAVGGITISNSKANLDIDPGQYLFPWGNITNSGTIRINPGKSSNNAHIRFDASAAINGTGSLILFANQNDLGDAQLITNGTTITQGAGHSIRGTGFVGAVLVNNGTVRADSLGEVLRLTSGAKTNNSLFAASGGGILGIDSVAVSQGPSGVIRAQNSSTVSLTSMSVTGGKVESTGSGLTTVDGVSTFSAVTTAGNKFYVNPGAYILSYNGLTNNGIITVNPDRSSNNGYIRFDSDGTLSGTGEVLLQANQNDLGDAQLLTNGVTITHGPNHLIHGTGFIGAVLVNNGTILADSPAEVLRVTSGAKTNNSLMAATGGGILGVDAVTVTQSADGLILAQDASLASFTSMTLVGGEVATEGSGKATVDGVSGFHAVTNTGTLNVNPGGFILTYDGLINNGVITVNPDRSSNNAHLRFDSDGTLGGTGEVLLQANQNDLGDAQLLTNAVTITHGPDHLIHGTGYVGAVLVNNGTILADSPAEVLRITSGAKTNNSLIAATGGGILGIDSVTVTQGDGGVILAQDASLASFTSMTLVGGEVATEGSGKATVDGISGFHAVANTGTLNVNPGAYILTYNGLINNGTITVNPDRSSNNAHLRVDGAGEFSGTGEIILRANDNDLADAQLWGNGVAVVVGPAQTVRGTGLFNGVVVNNGTLAPGESIGRFQANSSLTFGESSVYEVQAAGISAGQFDTINVSGVATVAGALNISLIDAYIPDTCAKFAVITANSVQGAFDSVNGDAGNGRVWRAVYSNNKVEAIVTCYADMQPDCALDLFDFLAFVNLFNAQDPVADCTHDGSFDLFDFLCFVNAFNQGC